MRLVQFASSYEEGVLYCDLANKQYYELSIDEMMGINDIGSYPVAAYVMGLSSVLCGVIAYFNNAADQRAANWFLLLAFVLSIVFSCVHTCSNQVRIGKEVQERRPIPFDYEKFRRKMKKSKKVYGTIILMILISGLAFCAMLLLFLATQAFTAGILTILCADILTMGCLTLQPIGKIRVRRQIAAQHNRLDLK